MAHIAKDKPTKFTVDEIVTFLKNEAQNETIEGQLIRTKLIRELYKQLGDPQEEDFKEEFKHGYYWDKMRGYTTYIETLSELHMRTHNNRATDWNIKRPSETKREIVKDYEEDGWHCTVQAYNVLCSKYVKHPRYDNLWVYFYSSRDCNKYEYVIEVENE